MEECNMGKRKNEKENMVHPIVKKQRRNFHENTTSFVPVMIKKPLRQRTHELSGSDASYFGYSDIY